MCHTSVDDYVHALILVPECYKTQKMFDKAANTFPSAIQFFPECYKIQKTCDNAVHTCLFLFYSVPD